ncbi:MAG: PEGA domain-containing protein [Deltaproteobacteria bacterium]|nr:MAG: PEGA domain-containing protein [Deltaproteobacteria bacterium]
MTRLLVTLASVTALAVVGTGCATLTNDTHDVVRITSDPPGATVDVDGQLRGRTPLELRLAANRPYEVRVAAEGYPEATRVVDSSIGAGYIVADILLGLVPVVIDLATGTLWDLDPTDMHFQFAPLPEPEYVEPSYVEPAHVPGVEMPTMPTMPGHHRSRHDDVDDDGGGARTEQHCCLNGAFYACPDIAAVGRCAPPELARCMMGCGFDGNCPEQCLADYPPDPSDCSRQPSNDGRCR